MSVNLKCIQIQYFLKHDEIIKWNHLAFHWPLWGESIFHQGIPLKMASDAEHCCFLWSVPDQTVEQTIKRWPLMPDRNNRRSFSWSWTHSAGICGQEGLCIWLSSLVILREICMYSIYKLVLIIAFNSLTPNDETIVCIQIVQGFDWELLLALSVYFSTTQNVVAWWRHQMETFSALLALCAGSSPVTGQFPSQKPVTRSLGVFFDLHLNKRLSKQSWG